MKKINQYMRLLLVGMLGLILVACGSPKKKATPKKSEVKITMLGTSDIHGRYMPWDYSIDEENKKGSLAQISTIVNKVRDKEDHVVLVDEGDFIQDNSSELFQDMPDHPGFQAMNQMKYDAFVLGNHEFDYGMPKLDKLMQQMDFPVLAGNLYQTGEDESHYPGTTIVERGGVKLGIIGLTTPMVYEFKEDTDIFDDYEFKDTAETTRACIDALKGKVDAIVGIFHMGVENENDHPFTGVTDIANEFPEFDVIFAGHMHALENTEVNDVVIVEPEKYATHVSRVDLTFDTSGKKPKLTKRDAKNIEVEKYEPDKKIEKILEKGHKMARKDANIVIGQLTGMDMVPAMKTPQIPVHQIQETPLTNFFNEVMMYYSNGADVVAHQIDNDTAQIKKGDIKKKDIASTYQYAGGEVTVFEMTGQDLKDYMEWSADYFHQAEPGDVTISFNPERRDSKYSTHDIFGGVKYEFDLTEPTGSRVKNLTWLDGTPVKMDETLKIGMNAYRLKFLISDEGPLKGREFKQLYSTQDESAFGEEEGTVRRLAARYIKDVKDGTYKGHLLNHWKITGVAETPDYISDLIAKDVIDLGHAESGKGNIKSVNLDKKPSQKDIKKVAKAAKIDAKKLKDVKTFEDLYKQVHQMMK